MSTLDLKTIRDNLNNKTTLQLIDILSYAQDDYNQEVIPIIEDILFERGISKDDITAFGLKYQNLMQNSNSNKSRFYKKTPFYITIIVVAIGSWLYRTIATTYFNNRKSETGTPKNVWTKEYEKQVYDVMYKSSDNLLIDDYSHDLFVTCEISKIKAAYPRGLTNDTVGMISFSNRMSKDCINALALRFDFKMWSPAFEDVFLKKMLDLDYVKPISKRYKVPFCKCYMNELKNKYPTRFIDSVPEKIKDSLNTVCAKRIKSMF